MLPQRDLAVVHFWQAPLDVSQLFPERQKAYYDKRCKMATSWENWGVKTVMESHPIGMLKRWTEDVGESKCMFWVASSPTCPSAWRRRFLCSRESWLHKEGGFSVREAVCRNCPCFLLPGLPLPCWFWQSFPSVSYPLWLPLWWKAGPWFGQLVQRDFLVCLVSKHSSDKNTGSILGCCKVLAEGIWLKFDLPVLHSH